MMSLSTVFWLVTVAVALFFVQLIHLTWFMSWCDRQTNGLAYYGRTRHARTRFQQRIRRHALILGPICWLLSKCGKFKFSTGTFHYRGVAGPKAGSCSESSFRTAEKYQPTSSDVFVVTQMRSGTTWMQHLVFQVLTRGSRDLAAEDTSLNAISPWLESHKSVTMDAAPTVGDRKQAKRIVKTHLPATLCPYHEDAKYIYVVRHPVSCFASCVDFVRSNLRGFEPSLHACLDWFLSRELMWWGTWCDHLRGWHERATTSDNVLVITFEKMKADLRAVIVEVADFLELDELSERELATIEERCGFEYMKRNASVFEMHPPHVLQVPDQFFVNGRTSSDTQMPTEVRDRIRAVCQKAASAGDLPLATLYPDLLPASPIAPTNAPACDSLVGMS